MPEIRVLPERCVSCGDCVKACPQSGPEAVSPVLEIQDGAEVVVLSTEGCICCFTCVEFCRAAAIAISNAPAGQQTPEGLYPTRPASRII
jgi:formate hydrogenlyase subunit 6/NADH:ubiquinone oxidoreductase subunit I